MDSEMRVKVLSIKHKTSDVIEVCLCLAAKQYQFLFSLERDVTDSQFISLTEEREFSQLFAFNVHISSQVLRLVVKAINGEVLNFPVDVGCFYSGEEALAQQKYFIEN